MADEKKATDAKQPIEAKKDVEAKRILQEKRAVFLAGLRADQSKFTAELLRDIIMGDDPGVFIPVIDLIREMRDANQIPNSAIRLLNLFDVWIPTPGVMNTLFARGHRETLIETVLKVMADKNETASKRERFELHQVLTECITHSQPPCLALQNFLQNGSPLLIPAFFAHINRLIAYGGSIEDMHAVFMPFIDNGLLIHAAKHNRTAVLTGFKTIGIDLNTKTPEDTHFTNFENGQYSAIHALAGDASISTAKFLLQHGVDINARDAKNRTPLWYVRRNIKWAFDSLAENKRFYLHYPTFETGSGYDPNRYKSDASMCRYLGSKIDKAIFALEHAAELSFSDAELQELQQMLSDISRWVCKHNSKHPGISFANVQYLRGLIAERVETPQQASRYFMDAAVQGHVKAAIKLAEFYQATHKEEDAFVWYQQAINNSPEPQPTLQEVMGLDNMIRIAHGLGLRKTEIKPDSKQLQPELKFMQKSQRILMNALVTIDYSQQPLSAESSLLLAHTLVDHDPTTQCQQALALACRAYDQAMPEELALHRRLAMHEDSVVDRKLALRKELSAREEPRLEELSEVEELPLKELPEREESSIREELALRRKLPLREKSPLFKRAQEDISHIMMLILSELFGKEKEHYNGIKFMPEPSKCDIVHYKRLCLELACINLEAGQTGRAQHWYTIVCILSNDEAVALPENPLAAIKKQVRDIASIVTDLMDEEQQVSEYKRFDRL